MSLIVGVTGHRFLSDEPLCRIGVRLVLKEIVTHLAAQIGAEHLVLLSPLAEGADRIVAEEWLNYHNVELECPLPLEVDDYLNDFTEESSRQQFLSLLDKSNNSIVMEQQNSRAEAYRQVGYYVVDHSDVLIAVWSGKGLVDGVGTAAMVSYARSINKPLFWIHSDQEGHVLRERIDEIKKFRRRDCLDI